MIWRRECEESDLKYHKSDEPMELCKVWYSGIKGTIYVLNNPDFDYNGLPLWGVHCILAAYLLFGVIITIITIVKWIKFNRKRQKF